MKAEEPIAAVAVEARLNKLRWHRLCRRHRPGLVVLAIISILVALTAFVAVRMGMPTERRWSWVLGVGTAATVAACFNDDARAWLSTYGSLLLVGVGAIAAAATLPHLIPLLRDPKAVTENVLTLVLLAATAFAAAIAFQSHVWTRRNRTIDFARSWNAPEMLRARTTLSPYIADDREPRASQVLWEKWAQRKRQANDQNILEYEQPWKSIDEAIREVVNHFEIVCLGVERGALDPDLAYDLYGDLVVYYYFSLHDVLDRGYRRSGTLPILPWIDRQAYKWRVRVEEERKLMSSNSPAVEY